VGPLFVHPNDAPIELDKRERARFEVPDSIAILFSAPIFEIFHGEPYERIENLRTLGPDILPYDGAFDGAEFVKRLNDIEHRNREIGAVLLDQRVCAGIGNYLRADLLLICGIDPWKRAGELSLNALARLCEEIPLMAARSLNQPGQSVPDEWRERLLVDETLSYGGRIVEWAARHAAFRRTNLPCLRCGGLIKQKQQVVYKSDDGDEENENRASFTFARIVKTSIWNGSRNRKRNEKPPKRRFQMAIINDKTAIIIVDVEADGPIPSKYSMVSFGAVVVEAGLSRTFYGQTKPISQIGFLARSRSVATRAKNTKRSTNPPK
jgi:formamidopyrimidine-DNA glycosylase